MGLLDRLRKGADNGAERPPPATAGGASGLEPPPLVLGGASLEAPVRTSARSITRSSSASGTPARPGQRYDPTQPGQTPVSGVDLVMFATLRRRLTGLSADEQAAVLAGCGHTLESWNTVNTVWVARLCRMPFLYEAYDDAGRSEGADDL